MFFPADDATEEDWPLSPPPARRVVGLGLPRPSGNPHRGPRSPQHLRMLRPPEVTADSTLNLGASACLDPTRCRQLRDKVGSDEKRARAPRTSERGGGLDDSTLQLVFILRLTVLLDSRRAQRLLTPRRSGHLCHATGVRPARRTRWIGTGPETGPRR